MTYIKSQSSFQCQVEECNSLFYCLSHYEPHILIPGFLILVSKLSSLDLFGDLARLLVLKKDQINKLFLCLFSQYDLAQVVNSISQVGLSICFSVAFSGCEGVECNWLLLLPSTKTKHGKSYENPLKSSS